MNIYIVSLLCFAFCSFLLGFMIFLKRRDAVGRLWFLYSFVTAVWAIGYSVQINNKADYEAALLASRMADAAAIFIPVIWLRFIYAFLNKPTLKKIFYPVYFLSFAILITTPTKLFIPGLKDKSKIGFEHFVYGGISFHFFTVLFFIVVLYAFLLIIHEYRRGDITAEQRQQIKFLLIAESIGFGAGSTAFLPCYDIDVPIAYCTVFLPLYPFIMALAITRYRLLDVDEIISAMHKDKLAAIGTLATSINHEIRNPLYIIQGLSETFLTNSDEGVYLTETQALEKSKEILRKTNEQSTRAMQIMKSFALFAKQSAETASEIEAVSLQETLDRIIPLVRHELILDRIELNQNIPEELIPLRADKRQVEQILFNLIVNACQAIKAQDSEVRAQRSESQNLKDFLPHPRPLIPETSSPSSLGQIVISASQQNGHINITIRDNGPGIPAGQLKRIFEPFFTTKSEGTGLGLYITKQLVERNGGKIFVESKTGEGTSFLLRLPSK